VVYILLHVHRKKKLTIAKLMSPCLSYNVVVSLPFESLLEYPDMKLICQILGVIFFELIGIYQKGIIVKTVIVD
jgi:hypothetical protein